MKDTLLRTADVDRPRGTPDDELRPLVLGKPAAGIALLVVSGAVLGGAIGASLLFVLQFGAPGGVHLAIDIPFSLVIGGGFGAMVGAVSAPLLGITVLRRVPYGLAMLGTATGTLVGAAIGYLSDNVVKGGLAGYALAAAVLFLRYRHRQAAG
jgi:hypothetical protein